MPTLKLVASLSRKKGGNHSRSRGSIVKKSATDDCNDDRFSQTPNSNNLAQTQTQKKGKVTQKYACHVNNSSNYSNSEIAPFSIASAIRNHRTHNKEKDISSSSSSATDIVAVVLSSAIRQPPLPVMASHSKTSKNNGCAPRIHLLLGDQSLPRGQCARVSIVTVSSSNISPGSENVQMTGRLGQLQPGDVVRWNRLEVWKDYKDESMMPGKKRKLTHNSDDQDIPAVNRHRPLLSVICDLSLSWRDPAAGPSLARLCRIVPRSSPGHGMQQQQPTSDNYDLEWENIIPPSMDTSKEVVMELARWYCANAMPHFSKSTAMLPTHQPCQRRRLCEITVPNMLSHVVVKVLRCEKATSSYATPCKTTNDPVVTHVTLSDGAESDDLLGMGGSVNHGQIGGALSSLPKSISAILLQSMKEGSHVLLTHTLSQSASPFAIGGGASLQGRESLVLTPTRETTATILTRDHPYFPFYERSTREEDNPFASQPLTLERASQLFSMTQHNSPPIIDSIPSNHCRGMLAVIAPLMDIIVDGIDSSFMEGSHWQTPHKLSRFLIDCPSITTGFKAMNLGPSYRSATLIFEPSKVSREIVVNADGNALKLLCVDVPVEDMVPTISPNHYLCHVGELLKGLCSGGTPIRWVLEQESECNWFVTNATLLEI
mmetsp:Transcript_2860/g.5312  ORF Transcript_2860/g.5312 Transcript_2860/m.5312 type:complete len:658 (+) Transcript_2860:430-2403(+)